MVVVRPIPWPLNFRCTQLASLRLAALSLVSVLLMIPRLTPKQVKSVNNSRVVPLIHYTGPKKVLPPAISKNIEISYDEVCARQISLEAAQKERCRVAQFPHEGARCNGVEWFQQLLSQESECSETCKHIHVWSINWCTTITSRHHSHNTNIYAEVIAWHGDDTYSSFCGHAALWSNKQVCWYHSVKFHNVIAHPGGMHIIQSFISCIAKLMKSSGLEVHMWLQHIGAWQVC